MIQGKRKIGEKYSGITGKLLLYHLMIQTRVYSRLARITRAHTKHLTIVAEREKSLFSPW